jgi:hypothetical protein
MTLRLRVPKLRRWGICKRLGFILPRDRIPTAISLVIGSNLEGRVNSESGA